MKKGKIESFLSREGEDNYEEEVRVPISRELDFDIGRLD